MHFLIAALLASALVGCSAPPDPDADSYAPIMLDDFEDLAGWSAHPADGVELAIVSGAGYRGQAMRLDFNFASGGGYAVARKAFAIRLPDNYAFSFRIRGEAPPNTFEFKLIDPSGENVWWSVRRDVHFLDEWERFVVKKRHLSFAWGPLGGGEVRDVAAIELVVTAGSGGGSGSVWIDELELRPMPPPDQEPPPPVATASSERPGAEASRVLDDDPGTSWQPAVGDSAPWIALDFSTLREYGGLVFDWGATRNANDYTIEIADDDAWRTVRTVVNGNGRRDYIYLPESESRRLRVQITRSSFAYGPALLRIAIQPLAWSESRESFFAAVASDYPTRGSFPRGFSGEQAYWTVVGTDGDRRESLFGEEGAIETGEDRVSIEPFLYISGQPGSLRTWADARIETSLDGGYLPIPSVAWRLDDLGLDLEIAAFAIGPPGSSSVAVRYLVENDGPAPIGATLLLAVRPFQVNPPSQTLGTPGGTAPIHELAIEGRTIMVNGHPAAISLDRPSAFGAYTFDEGEVIADHVIAGGAVRPRTRVKDEFGAASGALAYALHISPRSQEEVDIVIPLHPGSPPPPAVEGAEAHAWMAAELEHARSEWRERLGRFTLELPESAAPVVQSLSSQLAYILVNRAGPAIQPGSRAYARSWIRDGSLTSWALLRLGYPEVVREFIRWFAPYQYASGKVPCVVDARGADPVPEHDSSGQLIFLIAEYYRHTGDREFLAEEWPHVYRAADYLDSLRHERLTPEFEAPDKRELYGILPPSISHEGYSAKPMHSYWDDFFALRGFKDAAFLAGEWRQATEGHPMSGGWGHMARERQAIADEFARDLAASVEVTMRRHGIDYVPGAADLGDFDATSTTIALSPAEARDILDPAALERTFERYYEFFRARRDGGPWEAFTPYEIRNIGAFVRLGWRERAYELLEYFLSYQRPVGWRQWPEVVRHDARSPHFLGDLPHTWVGSDYIRSVLDMLAYEQEADRSIILGAGVPEAWIEPPTGTVVRDLRTTYGPLSYTMIRQGDAVEVRIQDGLRMPPGGILVKPPLATIGEATVNGEPAAIGPTGEIIVGTLPATIVARP